MKAAIIDGYKRWSDYSGRTSRSQFWWFVLFTYITPLITGLVSLLFSLLFLSLGLSGLSSFSVILFFLYIINVPIFLAVAVRRMHDVGKSGWFILVPLYNLYLYVQPAVEKGRIPNWILAERTSLGFVGILVISSAIGFVGGETDSIGSLVLWSIIYLLIRRKNKSTKKPSEQ